MSNQQLLHLLILFLVVGSSVISAIVRKAQEARARKKAQDELEQRQTEILRTGRDPGLPREAAQAERGPSGVMAEAPPSPRDAAEAARRAEIARRRKEQLDQLRRQQASQGGSPAGTPVQTSTQSAPGAGQDVVIQLPGGRTLRIPAPKPGTPTPPSSQGQPPARRGEPSRPRPRPAARPEARTDGTRARQPAFGSAEARRQPLAPDGGPEAQAELAAEAARTASTAVDSQGAAASSIVRPVTIGGRTMALEDWRRALILNEILSVPVAARRPGEAPLGPS